LLDTRPLRAATFRHLAAAYCINEIGNLVGNVALAILVFDQTKSAIATATLFLALCFAPALFAQFLTSRVEVIPARRILPTLYVVEATIFGLLAVVTRHFSLPVVLVLASFDGVLSITAKALTRSANATHLIKAGLLREGNAILNIGAMLALTIGPAVGGLIVAWRGAGTALVVDSATFLVAAVIVATAPHVKIESDDQAGTTGRVRAGLEVIRSNSGLVRLFIAFGMALLLGSVAIPIEVIFAKQTLHAGDSGYGLILAAWGVGTLIGAWLFAATSRFRVTSVLAVSAMLIAVGYCGLAVSPTLAIACVFSALGGTGNGAAGIAAVTAIQQSIPLTAQTAVMAVFEGMNQVMPAIGFVIGGVATALSSPRAAYAIAGVGVALVVVAASARPIRGLDNPPVAVRD
jgi:predicted MFS family arabinose efflux permease